MILIIGGTGKVGGSVVEQLSAAGVKARGLARDPSKVKLPNIEAVKGDNNDLASVAAALQGIDKLFLLTPSLPGSVETNSGIIDAAKKAGVKHVVKLSVAGADPNSPISIAKWHGASEAHLKASGLEWTLLRPGSFTQNFLNSAATIKKDGAFYNCTKDGKGTWIDARDIAAVAVKALTESGHEGQTYNLTGQEPMSNAEAAARIGKYLGKPVKYVDLPPEQFKQGMISAGLPEWMATDFATWSGFTAQGYTGTADPTLTKLLSKVRNFDDFLATYGAAFK
ncbi:MAG: SDR family oxidoreductase [Myxococcaceae bacterium]